MPQRWSENPNLGVWISVQRRSYKASPRKISQERIDRLNELGFIWEIINTNWEDMFALLKAYKQKYGDCNVPQAWPENLKLGNWVGHQRNFYRAIPQKLSQERIDHLNELGFMWDPSSFKSNKFWEDNFALLKAYKQKYGDCNVPQAWPENSKLGSWVGNQRSTYQKGKLSKERIKRLEALGFEWTRRKD